MEYKYTLIVSQYYHSHHMFIVEHKKDFIKKAKEFVLELIEYKRDQDQDFSWRKHPLGDLDDQFLLHDHVRPRYNVNDSGDIYFINSNNVDNLKSAGNAYSRETKTYKKKSVIQAINDRHKYDVVRNLVEKHFTIAKRDVVFEHSLNGHGDINLTKIAVDFDIDVSEKEIEEYFKEWVWGAIGEKFNWYDKEVE